MTSQAVVVEQDAELQALADTIKREHAIVVSHISEALEHAIRAGDALNAAFVKIGRPSDAWRPFLESVEISQQTASLYRRVAFYAADLAAAEVTTVNGARRHLRKQQLRLPWVIGRNLPLGDRERARAFKRGTELRQAGATYAAIADELAMSHYSVWMLLNPGVQKRRQREQTAARSALRRERRDALVRVAGGATHEGYSLLRKSQQVLQVAIEREADKEAKQALKNALRDMYRAEDEMFRAVRLTQERSPAAIRAA